MTIVALLASLTAAFATVQVEGQPVRGPDRILNIGMGAELDTLDPHRSTRLSASWILLNICEGLTAYGPDGVAGPGVAERWTVTDDGLFWTFHLRPDARWADGTSVAASDFVESWRRLVDPATAASFANLLSAVENVPAILRGEMGTQALGVQAADARTLHVRLWRPAPDLPDLLALPFALPLHPAARVHFPRAGALICNGPYRLAEHRLQEAYFLEPNDHHPVARTLGISHIHLHVTEDADAELKRFRAGDLDVTYTLPASQLAFAAREMPESLRIDPAAGLSYIQINMAAGPLAGRGDLRRALALALDRSAIAGLLGNVPRPALSLIPIGLAGYTPPVLPDPPQQQRDAEAQALMAAAGYGPQTPLRLTILHTRNETTRHAVIAASAMWKKKLGVETTIEVQEARVLADRVRTGAFGDMVVRSWVSPTLMYAAEILRPGGAGGLRYDDPELVALVTALDGAVTVEAQQVALSKLDTYLCNQGALIPILFGATMRLVSPSVSGWNGNIRDTHIFKYIKWR
ncbi:peptide ABC transporter substrate-binding protein [Niveispirillum irakense]|uniref:peptide ABC transporter substrate-binding protein n=1 Tax=Niveispirillum irakense TaxID=34011 RepID=UPI0013766A13|nr:peptide ABC transporter substrate-binding protein [Niveispirillum irakense]